MEFLIALVIVFIGIGVWIHYHGDEVPPDEEDYIIRSSRYSYEDDNDGFRHHSHHDDDDSEDDDNDGDSDSDDGSDGGDGD